MKTVILHNILSSNSVYKLKTFINANRKNLGEVEVWFCGATESNRHWQLHEKIPFKYKILRSLKLELRGADLFTYFLSFSVLSELRKNNPDRVIINGWDQFAYQLTYIWAFMNHVPITLWSGSTVNEKSWRRTITLPLVKWFVHISANYIAYGQRAKEYLQILGADSNKITIFLNDVNQAYFRGQAQILLPKRQRLQKQLRITTPHTLLFVGQLIERKGVMDLLNAFSVFAGTHRDWSLVLVGDGILKQRISTLIQTLKIPRVHLLEEYEQYNLPKVYACADYLILPSHEEVWGLVINEALASGLKVIASDVCGCVPDLVVPSLNNFVFKTGSVRSLITVLNRAAQHERRNAQSQTKLLR